MKYVSGIHNEIIAQFIYKIGSPNSTLGSRFPGLLLKPGRMGPYGGKFASVHVTSLCLYKYRLADALVTSQ